jgi:hypothetical protein
MRTLSRSRSWVLPVLIIDGKQPSNGKPRPL